jgi:O-antigen/teichoic acid export membrane protein
MKNMEVLTPELECGNTSAVLTPVEATAVRVLRIIPGFQWLSPSARVIQAIRGGAWSVVGYGAGQVLRLASTLVLARMLVPQAFGLVALVNVFLSGLEMLSDLGVGMDVVQHPRGDDPLFINTAYLIQAGRGLIIWIVATAMAYPFARFYHQPALLALIVASSLSVLFRGLNSSSIWSLTRHVRLGTLTALNTGSDLIGFVVALVWALSSPTAWALVIGRITSAVALMIASHCVAQNKVSLRWDRVAAGEIFAFGAGIFVSTSTYFLGGEAERLVIGKFTTLVELGCFSLALSISSAVAKGLQQVVAQVFFPMMSESLRRHSGRAVEHFRRARHMVLVVSGCLGITFVLTSNKVVVLLLGQKYAMAGWMLQLLGIRGALELFMSLTASMLFALGVSRYAAIGNVAKLIFLAGGLSLAFIRFGLHGAVWVLMLAPVANYIPLIWGMGKYSSAALRTELISAGILSAAITGTMLLVHLL